MMKTKYALEVMEFVRLVCPLREGGGLGTEINILKALRTHRMA